MDRLGGTLVVVPVAAVAVILIGLAILHFGFHAFRRRGKGRSRAKSGVMNDSRIEVLETTVIDEDRRLVLIRCDRIEHLIMIGGQADLVVENDVRKVRGPGAPTAKIPGIEPERRPAAAPTPDFEPEKRVAPMARPAQPAAFVPEPAIASVPKAPEPQRALPRPSIESRPAPVATRALSTTQPAPLRAGIPASKPAAAKPEEPARAIPPRPQPVDTKSGRRDTPPPPRRIPLSPTPATRPLEPRRAPLPAATNDRTLRPTRTNNGRSEPSPGLPAAQIPWSDPDSIENEIVRALRFDPQTRGDQPAQHREAPTPKALTDSATTLGDLADRLEEALAREVQSASELRPAPAADEFGFESETPARAPESTKPKPAPQKARPDKRERPEPVRSTAKPAAETESPAEPPAERREEAPVISLNSRRRESSDQLEDEMARLLGELTSDNKGR